MLCTKCLNDQNRRGTKSSSFYSTMSLTKHLRQIHNSEKSLTPTFEEIFKVLEEITIALENNIDLNSIKKVVEWRMIVL